MKSYLSRMTALVAFLCTALAMLPAQAATDAAANQKGTALQTGDETVEVTFVYTPTRRERQTIEDVTVAGEFNNWDGWATPMTRNEDGTFSVTVKLKRGTMQWKLLIDGNWVQNMETIADRIKPKPDRFIPDPYGGRNAQNDF